MLDKTTKTKIDTARDILVGKVPNPQSQVELITIAMIYKFMDDMDMQNIEMGGNRIFFTDDLEDYAWSKVLSPKLNNWERISLYAKALDKLQIAKQIPELFRKIFKGAFLPFRDGATLSLFLNEIDGFSYNNSENLGNAFEYLLSIMGSQGDAGQFRTPRHIIDFIVDVVNPSKTDTILDPACGTAGFLISAYKHIIKQPINAKKPLTPAQHQKLMENIVGYDISPDMVKLASVNLFLHQFPQPKIYEYDTLSSEERWNDKFDIILANPPFMTPKGGIQPHNKFGVKANRAEVLFVDYMMEHLNLKGKAGFVVPEGIIFQSATAYKALRKMMVEDNYLYAVVSLPSGVFNPYSGVKTSILFFDRELAKKTKDILFVKVENDGYDLGAQRREIKDNDLPEALKLLQLWQKSIGTVTIPEELTKSKKITIVSKEKLAEDGEYNLSAVRYQQAQDFSNCQYEMVRLGDVAEISAGNSAPQDTKMFENGIYPFCRTSDVGKIHISSNFTNISDKLNCDGIKGLTLYKKETILLPKSGASTFLNHRVMLGIDSYVSSHLATIYRDENKVLAKFLFYMLLKIDAKSITPNSAYPSLKLSEISNIEIPLPPLSVQEEIVKELDQYQAIIDGAQKVVDNWKPTFEINPEWKKVKLGDEKYFSIEAGGTPLTTETSYWNGAINWATLVDLPTEEFVSYLLKTERTITEDGLSHSSAKLLPVDTVIVSTRATIGRVAVNKIETATNQGFKNIIIKDKTKANPLFTAYMVKNLAPEMEKLASGGTFKEISKTSVASLSIPLPSLDEQKAIIAQIEQEKQYVDACKKLIEISKQKISDKIKSIWNCDNE
jgi:N-6 DNA methylase